MIMKLTRRKKSKKVKTSKIYKFPNKFNILYALRKSICKLKE